MSMYHVNISFMHVFDVVSGLGTLIMYRWCAVYQLMTRALERMPLSIE